VTKKSDFKGVICHAIVMTVIFYFMIFSHNCHSGCVFPGNSRKMKNLSVTVIALKFLIFFLISVTAVTVKPLTGRQFYHLPN